MSIALRERNAIFAKRLNKIYILQSGAPLSGRRFMKKGSVNLHATLKFLLVNFKINSDVACVGGYVDFARAAGVALDVGVAGVGVDDNGVFAD